MAPALEQFTKLKEIYREDRLKCTELESIYKATCEDLERLRLSEKFLLDASYEARGLDFSGNGSSFGGLSQHNMRRLSGKYVREEEDGLSANNCSISALSRNSNLPLVHVDNYFQKSESSF